METLKARADITSVIETVCQEKGIKNHIITDVQTNQKGEGYLGEIFMVTVKDANSGKQQEIVIKAAFVDEKIREMVPIRMSFENEIHFYTCVYPSFQKLEKDRKVVHVQQAPECLEVSLKDQQEMLALENLKSSGFEIFDKKSILDDDHVELIFKTYGRFHAYSFVLRDQKPEEYAKIVKGIYNVWGLFIKNELFAKNLVEISKIVQSTLITGEDDVIIKKYEKYVGENVVKIFDDSAAEDLKYSAILHGDCWSNNMMFKYEDTADAKKPTDMRLIDFQLMKLGSPVCDLSYCLYSGASKKIFDNLNMYLQIYHDSFSSLVRELGSDPEKLFPFAALKEQWKRHSRFGMIMSFTILRMKLTHKEDLIDLTDTDKFEMDDVSEVFAKMRCDEEGYIKRIRGLLWHMSEIGAL